jgi:hypothetical protein
VLVELGVMEQRYDAVKEVLDGGVAFRGGADLPSAGVTLESSCAVQDSRCREPALVSVSSRSHGPAGSHPALAAVGERSRHRAGPGTSKPRAAHLVLHGARSG